MVQGGHQASAAYRIKAYGTLDPAWSDWFNGMTITCEDAGDGSQVTILMVSTADQAKLRGILSKMWDLNLTVISVVRVEPGVI